MSKKAKRKLLRHTVTLIILLTILVSGLVIDISGNYKLSSTLFLSYIFIDALILERLKKSLDKEIGKLEEENVTLAKEIKKEANKHSDVPPNPGGGF